MQTYVEIFSQGEEILTGQVVDTNAAWLSQKLVAMGFVVKRHSSVGDNLADLKSLLSEIAQRADCCICTGGLGPTVDDLTALAVSEAFDLPLELDPIALEQIQAHYQRRQRVMAGTNRKQALFPQGAERIDNEWGTAPGFALQYQRCWFIFVPGVPAEMKPMFNEKIAQNLAQQFQLQASRLITLRSVGIGESDLQAKLNNIQIPETVQLSFRAADGEVQTKLLFPATSDPQAIRVLVNLVHKTIGDFVFSVDNLDGQQGDLIERVDHLMQQAKLTLALQETVSQGLIAAKCIAKPWLVSSVFSRILIEDEDYLKAAENHALKLQQQAKTDLVLVQLYQGNFEQKTQNIKVYTLLLGLKGMRSSQTTLAGHAKRKQSQAATLGLDLLRRYLQGIPAG
ncbi:MAG: competence/damage-inducible protein A [Methyloprofundus sp.]|nr:competence/damage-inducible protein A [Methyloprofundus sp.]